MKGVDKDLIARVALPIGILIIVFYVITVILKKTGLIEDKKEEERIKKQKHSNQKVVRDVLNNSSLDGISKISSKTLDVWYETFIDSFGIFNDQEDVILQLFFEIPTKPDVRAFSKYFEDKKGENLFSYMSARLNEDELTSILTTINEK